jgi:hypothetical protein
VSTHTTYSDLTGSAAGHLSRAIAALAEDSWHPATPECSKQRPGERSGERADLDLAIAAHQDLSAALAHLGRVLSRPLARPLDLPDSSPRDDADPAPRRGGGPDARTLRTLARRARPRDWSSAPPADNTIARSLWEAARCARAAADLWATHQTLAGAPRSPEASRMRHPSVLGNATREWRALVHAAAEAADGLLATMEGSPATPPTRVGGSAPSAPGAELAPLLDYPRPKVHRAAPTVDGARPHVAITVARPGGSVGPDLLGRVRDRVERLRHVAWVLAEAGTAPAPALANFAAIGVLVNRVAADAVEQAPLGRGHASSTGSGGGRDSADRARRALAALGHWSAVLGILADVRTPHPPTSALQIERLDLAQLLQEALRSASGPTPSAVAGHTDLVRDPDLVEDLDLIAARYAEVAEMNLRAVRRAHERGELYVVGRAMPPDALVRRPDLVDAKLKGRLVPAPALIIQRLETAYNDVIGGVPLPGTHDGRPPAA